MLVENTYNQKGNLLNYQFYADHKSQNVNDKLLRQKIDAVVYNDFFNIDLKEVISTIREVLQEYEEYLLKISLFTERGRTYVEFLNKNLSIYNKTIFFGENKKQRIEMNYDEKSGLKINTPVESSDYCKVGQIILDELDTISSLKDINPQCQKIVKKKI